MKQVILIIFLIVISTACSTTHQTREAPKASGFLVDYTKLDTGMDGEAHRLYINKVTNWSTYNKIMIDPIQIWASKESKLHDANKKELENVLSYLHANIRNALKGNFTIVHQPGPGVLRLKVALTDGEQSQPVSDLLSNLIPVGLALSYIKRAAFGTHLSVGNASVEAEVVDSLSNKRLIAAMDARSGTKVLKGKFDSWGDVKEAFEYWSMKLNSRLTKLGAGK